MRCSAWSSLAISVCSALLLAAPANAHVDASPTFVEAGGNDAVSLVGHNDRELAMDQFVVVVPDGFVITDAIGTDGWDASFDERVATWTGGELPPDADATFSLDLAGPDEPGPAILEIEQRYPDDAVVRSQVALTVLPADDEEKQTTLVIALVGLLLAGTGAAVAVRRRRAASRR